MNLLFLTFELYLVGNLEAVRDIMFRTDVDLQIAGTTDVSNDAFSHFSCYFSINLDGLMLH